MKNGLISRILIAMPLTSLAIIGATRSASATQMAHVVPDFGRIAHAGAVANGSDPSPESGDLGRHVPSGGNTSMSPCYCAGGVCHC